MQYIRSKLFDLFLLIWTLVLGLATPVLMIAGSGGALRAYSRFWATGLSYALWYLVGLKYEIVGEIPKDRIPRLVVSNHQSAWETLIFAVLFPDISFVAKRELGRIPIFGWYLKTYPMVMIDRTKGRASLVDMIRQSQKVIAEGRSILIFPEGTRIPVDDTKQYHFGVAALYRQLNVPVLTIAHNAGCYWNDDYHMKYSGVIRVKVIEEILPGLEESQFLERIEKSINETKKELANGAGIDEWRWAMG
jgi:1-acyl-sn-glycerol-3-phosphate acyltransferase